MKDFRWRKRPVVVEVVQFPVKGKFNNKLTGYPGWFIDAIGNDTIKNHPKIKGSLLITTLEGVHIASPGDYIVQGVKGELYPCKPDIFKKTYERV